MRGRRGSKLLPAVVALILLAGFLGTVSPPVHAAITIVITDAVSCASITTYYPGVSTSWTPGICTITSGTYTIASGDTLAVTKAILEVDSGVAIYNYGTFADQLEIVIQTGALVLNYGLFDMPSASQFTNFGAFGNVGNLYVIDPSAHFYTDGTFTNSGTVSVTDGTFENLHSVTSSGTVTFGSTSTFINDMYGTVDNYPGGTFTDYGTKFDNSGTFINEGTMTSTTDMYSVTFDNSGTLTLNFVYGGFFKTNTLNNGGGKVILNGGYIENFGTINNDASGLIELNSNAQLDNDLYATVYDYGAMEGDYSVTLVNNGATYVECGATFFGIGVTGTGTLDFLTCPTTTTTASTTASSTTSTTASTTTYTTASTVTLTSGQTTTPTVICTSNCLYAPQFPGALGFTGAIVGAFVVLMLLRGKMKVQGKPETSRSSP